jgi:prepilin signal peptidase PulO-like enzyme (type II secretory pathway)
MDLFITIWLFRLGAVFGSFLACMGYRIPNKIKTTYPSSFCSNCKKPLKWYMNIPIISYIFLGGKCAYCKEKIGFIYFLCEILGAVLFALNYILFKFDINFFISTILACVFIVTLVSDFKYYYISDRVLIMGAVLLIIVMFIFMDTTDAIMRVTTGIIMFAVMFGIKIMGNRMFNKESLGDGDIKLMAVIGISVGLLNSFVALFFGSLTGLIYSLFTLKKNKEGLIPFGPFLIIGAMLVIYFSSYITPYLEELFSI